MYVYYGLKQGKITQNIDNKFVSKLINLVAKCSKITYTCTSFFPFLLLSASNVRMSEGTFCHVEVHI